MKINGAENNAIPNKKIFTFSISWDNPIIRFGEGIQKVKEPSEKFCFEVPRYYSRIFGASGLSAYLIAIYGLLYSTEWENKISIWQNSVLSQADVSLNNCFQKNEENQQSNSGKSSVKCEEKSEHCRQNILVHNNGNEINRQYEPESDKVNDSKRSSAENGLAEGEKKEKEEEEAATVSPYYRHQLFNELYFLVDGGTVWADSTYGVPNPYSNDFIEKIIGREGIAETQESFVHDEIVNKGKEEKEKKEKKEEEEKEKSEKEEEEKEKEGEHKVNKKEKEVVSESVTDGRSGWFNDTMAIMLQIPVEKFKVHDHIRLINKRLTSKDIYEDYERNDSICSKNGANKGTNSFYYDCNKNHNNHDNIISNTPILNHTISKNIDSSSCRSPINAMKYSNNIDNYDQNKTAQNETKNHLHVSDKNTKQSIKTNEMKNSNVYDVFIKQKEHILKSKNEDITAAMKVLHYVMETHDANVKNSKIAGDQVGIVKMFKLFNSSNYALLSTYRCC